MYIVQYMHTRRVWGVRQKRFMSSCYKHWVPAQVHTVASLPCMVAVYGGVTKWLL